MDNFLLIYHQRLFKSNRQIYGRLLLLNNNQLIDTFIATSGINNHQESFFTRGKSPIPPSNQIKSKWILSTIPSYQPKVKGIEGNFYPILPIKVELPDKSIRSEFGIHFDANVIGSSGCIVIKNSFAWNDFQEIIKGINSDNIKEIPLIVSYS